MHRTQRGLDDDLERIARGPCGGWHWNDSRDRRHYCPACVALANPIRPEAPLVRPVRPLPVVDDGVVDEIVVDRLVHDPAQWHNLNATPGERVAAARILGAGSWQALGLNGREFRAVS
jgi:hypothetical protein